MIPFCDVFNVEGEMRCHISLETLAKVLNRIEMVSEMGREYSVIVFLRRIGIYVLVI